MSTITAIIVDHYKSHLVPNALQSILQQKGDFNTKIILVDNAPNANPQKYNKLIKKHQNVRAHFPGKNIGYPKANNWAAQQTTSEFIFVINPDIECKNADVFQKILDAFRKDPKIAIIGTQQLCPNNKTELTIRRFPSPVAQVCRRTFLRRLPLFRHLVEKYECSGCDYSKMQEVDWLQSSFWAVRRDFWEEAGGFDEGYFVFMADTEMCHQAWKSGRKVVYLPDPNVHADGVRASSGGVFDFFRKKALRIHAKDALRYFWKHLFEESPRKRRRDF